ncbi:MAG: DUF1073 domain-containing protein [Clostridia bacterium]|nr:DUF1073 domain-containing protein [Clostridia bacterium]
MLADGAIRSGKTISMILSFLEWSLSTFHDKDFIIAGVTGGALRRNVLEPMIRILETYGISHELKRTESKLIIGSNTYHLFGADKDNAQDKLQGMTAAGAAEIPATKLFGRSPQGFNTNGESDLKNYAEMISGLQERMLRPALEKLLPVMAVSCWGFRPDDLDIVFEPIISPTPKERAELIDRLSGSVIEAWTAGLITREEAVEELKARGAELGVWSKLRDQESEA